ncbi:NAD(P)-dependent oxidoreductase [Sphaerisporangium melleum]|uniref:dTDP-4-dehydrorhamnose reductase n=1 Tax=Sphaerisporangium melleum TaxID=321316 RepID=A0A917QZ98_9ACTN|nr:dTDP-4-dehydrorhamnose reductase [Sphaerisporangium melleum]GGK79576.1 NAD(P)-dependent oxidoreductase [Sphaerisporangium melleum]GII69682.1 NAD(P)-dependent oxidoreductase [Sphaerisporangium melleum]
MKRLLIAGATGMLGGAVAAAAEHDPDAPEVLACGRDRLDLRYPDGVLRLLREERPDVVVNCAGWTAVDDAETHEVEALAVNGHGVRALALGCAEIGARLVHVSTDYVFDGTARAPYAEDAPTRPLNAYGRSKVAGERAVLGLLPETGYVVRTAWLYGAGGRNFVQTMINLEGTRDVLNVVDDQYGPPTWTGDLAPGLLELARAYHAPPGVYHCTGGGRTTWHGLAQEVFTLLGADPGRVRPIPATAYPLPAARPAYSVLGHARWAAAGLAPMRHWRDALHAAWPSLAGSRV